MPQLKPVKKKNYLHFPFFSLLWNKPIAKEKTKRNSSCIWVCVAATNQRQRKQHEESKIDETERRKNREKKKLKGRRTHRVWELDRIRAESTDTQAQIGNVNELSRKRNEKTEFVGRERERERREKSLETENSDLRRSHMREGKDSKEEKGRRRNQRNK